MSASLDLAALLDVSAAPPVRPRLDLRTGLLAAGVVAPPALGALARTLREARRAWSQSGCAAPLSLVAPPDAMERLEADDFDDIAREAGCKTHLLTFELDERALIRRGPALAERLRARGWGVALRGDPECPLPLGQRARAIYTELVLDPPSPLDPFLALDARDRTPLGQRIFAARYAGILLTARSASQEDARLLAAMGFDRAGGPCAIDTF
ncbi:MAG: hypothetical protein NW203_05795 [Hyphomonadaceae bacterium]|nr:hypothetical protein [Hyphomonadaceae bacterium]